MTAKSPDELLHQMKSLSSEASQKKDKESMEAQNYIDSLHGAIPLEFKTEYGKSIHTLFLESKKTENLPFKTTDLFLPGRMYYEWDLTQGGEESPDVPKVVLRNRTLVSSAGSQTSKDSFMTLLELSRLIEKCKRERLVKVEKAAQPVNVPPVIMAEEEDEDIFADAGRDYVLEVSNRETLHSVKSIQKFIEKPVEQEQDIPYQLQSILKDSERMAKTMNPKDQTPEESTSHLREDTDNIDLDSDAEDYGTCLAEDSGMKKARSDFKTEAEWETYQETASFMTGFSSRQPTVSSRPPFKRGSKRGGKRASSHLDKQLNDLDKVYQEKYGSGLTKTKKPKHVH